LRLNRNLRIEEGMAKLIYKILREHEWRDAVITHAYAGSQDDLRDGYIHFSMADQLKGTLEKYFRGCVNVQVAAFDPNLMTDEFLRYEASRGGALFPHYYGKINISSAVNCWQVQVPQTGDIDLPFLDSKTA